MTDSTALLAAIQRAARSNGDVLPPSTLLARLASTDARKAISNVDLANALFAAVDDDFPLLKLVRFDGAPSVSQADQERWAALMRWTIREFVGWKDSDDQKRGRLIGLFVVTQCCDWSDNFWPELPDEIGRNAALIKALEDLISSASAEYSVRGMAKALVWEQEAAHRLELADANGDWNEIAEAWRPFQSMFLPSVILGQMVRCLYRYAFDNLVRAVQKIRRTPVCLMAAAALSVEQRLELAIAGNNSYLQFACAYETFHDHETSKQLDPDEQQRMTELFQIVTGDSARWKAWMAVFNTYPARYPALQIPLGRVLAKASETALKAYVDSIDLYPTPAQPEVGRRLVAACLVEFRRMATLDQRKRLWSYAHERWQSWIGEANRDLSLFQINWSKLDYAVVGYAIECLEDKEREEVKLAIVGKMRHLSAIWHESLSRCITGWNQLLSQYQPYARATQVVAENSEDWLTETLTYRPTEFTGSYLELMFGSL
jgi:hypothetical protein